jgi:hypothetical protein
MVNSNWLVAIKAKPLMESAEITAIVNRFRKPSGPQ